MTYQLPLIKHLRIANRAFASASDKPTATPVRKYSKTPRIPTAFGARVQTAKITSAGGPINSAAARLGETETSQLLSEGSSRHEKGHVLGPDGHVCVGFLRILCLHVGTVY